MCCSAGLAVCLHANRFMLMFTQAICGYCVMAESDFLILVHFFRVYLRDIVIDFCHLHSSFETCHSDLV